MKSSISRRIMHFLYPTRCPVCGELIGYDERFCTGCADKLTPYSGDFRIEAAESFSAAFEYDDNITPAVMLLKRGVCGNADFALGGALADVLKENGIAERTDVIVPVPMYRSDERKRGYNQAELIAKVISRRLGIELFRDAAVKLRPTAEQKTLDRMGREINLRNAFAVALPEAITTKRILIVDDVCTTGATMAELTSILLANGAAAVHCASCCKTPLKK